MTASQETRPAIDPWGDNLIQDYKKVVTQFGLEPFDAKPFPEPNRLMRRGITFAGRDLKRIAECIQKKKPFYTLTGIQPSAEKIHLGTRSVIENVKYFQEHGAKTFVLVADLESAATRGISVEEGKKRAIQFHIPAYLALGLDIEKTQFYFQSENPTTFRLAFEASQKITLNEFKGAYGNPDPGKIMAALAQFADMILPQELEKKPFPGIIPVGIDQEPHIRLCRDYLHKIESQKRFMPISSIYNKFMPSMDGQLKMSKSNPKGSISLPEDPKAAEKVIKSAFTGGRATMEEQRRLGAEVDKDMVFELLKQHLVESDKDLEKIRMEYAAGKMLSGEIKQLASEKMAQFLEKFDADMDYYQKHIKDVQFLGFE
ncbi:MAG: tryptophan--tRNA ligase [Candidatus Iainarchaeum archaeon]|uniref:Tryptophan--tRNA ligase n=1 Tax=Candidatus Iainarchaeum sp. TaxID=3101447 RepID=A0A7T9I0X2_9ARCH|nr:MAG: tryptophan--tRNA ligase [Candidatus Diapherotrites archaeon]